jgi:hypothetical protein
MCQNTWFDDGPNFFSDLTLFQLRIFLKPRSNQKENIASEQKRLLNIDKDMFASIPKMVIDDAEN